MTEREKLELYTSVVPKPNQLIVQDMKFYAFVHYTVNTFTDKEWGNGTEDPKVFNPRCQDTDQWCKAIADAGMKGLILTCKHHDGFCLWPTKTTEHCIRNSSYKDGKGDVVKEVSESCKKYGLKFGVYLSPWDRNSEYYSTDKYNDFYVEQLTELLSNYGDIYMLWLDGACASDADGKPKQVYDFDRYYAKAYELQPNICISVTGPDIRWVGNESGKCRKSEWNVVPAVDYNENDPNGCQDTADYKKFQKQALNCMQQDLGSRKALEGHTNFMWYPAEVDVSIRKGWFWHEAEDKNGVKSLNKLMTIYYNSVGANGLFLLNIPPNTDGLLSDKDVSVLHEMGEWLRKEKSLKMPAEDVKTTEIVKTDRGYEWDITFPEANVDRIRLEEDTTHSQRIEKLAIYKVVGNKEKRIWRGTVVGFGRIAIFKPTTTDHLRVVVEESRLEPYIKDCEVYKSGAYRIKSFFKR